jgi:oxygen-independent coproporphyrinogen-3 oxidase
MNYTVNVADPKQLPNVQAALQILDPDARLVPEGGDWRIDVDYDADFRVTVRLDDGQAASSWEYRDAEIFDPRYGSADRRQRLKELIRLGIISLAGPRFGKKPPWGILSGVRPTKIFHYLRDKGLSVDEIRANLQTIYGLASNKADLVAEIGAKQERFFNSSGRIGVYIGIPFCPSRCHYCSFPAVPLSTHGHLVKDYLKALRREIEAMASFFLERGWSVETIYLGGGTPTSLDDGAFQELLEAISKRFRAGGTIEFTVEAGRPETITPAKLTAMVQAGATRISVNPQTMNAATLERIGRNHSVRQIIDAVQMVKTTRLDLNMDLILGLPGEGGGDFLSSMARVAELQPENVTIHTLAPKRAAAWRSSFSGLELTDEADLARAVEAGHRLLRDSGYAPYYLYRQRLILADQENTGFARPERESVYNIQMMEERQTIFGLGAGAVTKWVYGPEYRVARHQNPKCPATYSQRIDDEIVKKAQQTRVLLD